MYMCIYIIYAYMFVCIYIYMYMRYIYATKRNKEPPIAREAATLIVRLRLRRSQFESAQLLIEKQVCFRVYGVCFGKFRLSERTFCAKRDRFSIHGRASLNRAVRRRASVLLLFTRCPINLLD